MNVCSELGRVEGGVTPKKATEVPNVKGHGLIITSKTETKTSPLNAIDSEICPEVAGPVIVPLNHWRAEELTHDVWLLNVKVSFR